MSNNEQSQIVHSLKIVLGECFEVTLNKNLTIKNGVATTLHISDRPYHIKSEKVIFQTCIRIVDISKTISSTVINDICEKLALHITKLNIIGITIKWTIEPKRFVESDINHMIDMNLNIKNIFLIDITGHCYTFMTNIKDNFNIPWKDAIFRSILIQYTNIEPFILGG